MEFINKELIANELKRRIDFCNKIADASAELNLHNSLEANELLIRQYENLLSFLDTLEVKEVDLEKEVEDWVKTGPHTSYPWCTIPDAIRITAEHFYELGLKTRKESKI